MSALFTNMEGRRRQHRIEQDRNRRIVMAVSLAVLAWVIAMVLGGCGYADSPEPDRVPDFVYTHPADEPVSLRWLIAKTLGLMAVTSFLVIAALHAVTKTWLNYD